MLIIANNISTRNPQVASVFKQRVTGGEGNKAASCPGIIDIAESCLRAGADILEINLQQHYDRPEMMEFAIKAVQEVTDHRLCLSSDNAATLEAGLKMCRRPPIVNYVAVDTQRLQEILPLAAKYQAGIILLVSDPSQPADARQMLEKAEVLVGAANGTGIPNENIFLDPGIYHVTKEPGQRHMVEVFDFLQAIPGAFEPDVQTTVWLANSSAGAPPRLRAVIESALMMNLAGFGVSSMFLDVLRKENRRAIHLLKVFHNEVVYADGDI
jgi:5-methyltetrahydrofolate corrinoid/iron sulfur protein methyltransferase